MRELISGFANINNKRR